MAEIQKLGEAIVDADRPGTGPAIAPNAAKQNSIVWTSSFSPYYLSCYYDNIHKIHWYRTKYVNSISYVYLSFLPAKAIGTILTTLGTGTSFSVDPNIASCHETCVSQFLNDCFRNVILKKSCIASIPHRVINQNILYRT